MGAERQGAAQNTSVTSKKVSQRANKRKSVLVPFEGTLNRVFFVKGVYFEKARLFGTVSVQITDPLALSESMKHRGVGESIGLIRVKSRMEGNHALHHPEAPKKKGKSSKRRGSGRRRHSISSKASNVGGIQRDFTSTSRVTGPRQLLFTVYVPTSGQEFKIFVSKDDVEASNRNWRQALYR